VAALEQQIVRRLCQHRRRQENQGRKFHEHILQVNELRAAERC
jgi:hypothetical protein